MKLNALLVVAILFLVGCSASTSRNVASSGDQAATGGGGNEAERAFAEIGQSLLNDTPQALLDELKASNLALADLRKVVQETQVVMVRAKVRIMGSELDDAAVFSLTQELQAKTFKAQPYRNSGVYVMYVNEGFREHLQNLQRSPVPCRDSDASESCRFQKTLKAFGLNAMSIPVERLELATAAYSYALMLKVNKPGTLFFNLLRD